MLTPDNVTVAEYNSALALEEYTHARVTFPLDNIVFQDQELEQGGIRVSTYMNPDENMRFGIAYCTEVIINLFRNEKTEEVNFAHEFTLEFGVEIEGNIEWVTVGHFNGSKPVINILSDTIEFMAYDKMMRFEREIGDLLGTITFPCTVQDIFDKLCDLTVVDSVPGDEIADVMNRQILNADNWDYDTCRELLAAIAEANGCYAKITNDGFLKLVWFEDHKSDQSLTRDNCFGGTIVKLEKSYSKKWGSLENLCWKDVELIKYSEYDSQNNPFEFSHVRWTWNDDLNYYYRDVVQPPYDGFHNHRLWANVENFLWSSVENMKYKELEEYDGIAGQTYLIEQNPFLMYDTDTDVKTHLQLILDKLYDFHLYYVAYVTMVGNWLIEPGDTVMLEIMDNTFVEYPIFNRVLTWNGSCTCEYETTGNIAG